VTVIPSEEDPLLTLKQIAKIFSVHPTTVHTWIKAGKLKAIKPGGELRIQQSEMVRFANEKYGAEDG
jgi:excisionase family DNA binding protein